MSMKRIKVCLIRSKCLVLLFMSVILGFDALPLIMFTPFENCLPTRTLLFNCTDFYQRIIEFNILFCFELSKVPRPMNKVISYKVLAFS